MFNNVSLYTQYKGFNLCFWAMVLIAIVFSLVGQTIVAVLLGTLGLVSGAIAQLKLIRINQELFLINQKLFLSKLDVLLEEGVQ